MQGVSRLLLFMALEAEQLNIMFEVYFSLERIMRSCYRGVGQEGSRGIFPFFVNFMPISGWR